MKKIKNALLMIKRNIWVLVGFEAVFKLLSTLIFIPLLIHQCKKTLFLVY